MTPRSRFQITPPPQHQIKTRRGGLAPQMLDRISWNRGLCRIEARSTSPSSIQRYRRPASTARSSASSAGRVSLQRARTGDVIERSRAYVREIRGLGLRQDRVIVLLRGQERTAQPVPGEAVGGIGYGDRSPRVRRPRVVLCILEKTSLLEVSLAQEVASEQQFLLVCIPLTEPSHQWDECKSRDFDADQHEEVFEWVEDRPDSEDDEH